MSKSECEFKDIDGNINGPNEPLNVKGHRMGLKFTKDSNGCVVVSLRHKGNDDKIKAVGWAWMTKSQVVELLELLQN
jgi:hypothetical protein